MWRQWSPGLAASPAFPAHTPDTTDTAFALPRSGRALSLSGGGPRRTGRGALRQKPRPLRSESCVQNSAQNSRLLLAFCARPESAASAVAGEVPAAAGHAQEVREQSRPGLHKAFPILPAGGTRRDLTLALALRCTSSGKLRSRYANLRHCQQDCSMDRRSVLLPHKPRDLFARLDVT